MPHRCKRCDRSFRKMRALFQHEQAVHPVELEREHIRACNRHNSALVFDRLAGMGLPAEALLPAMVGGSLLRRVARPMRSARAEQDGEGRS